MQISNSYTVNSDNIIMKEIVSSLDNLSLSEIVQSPQENLKLPFRLPTDAMVDRG